MPTTIYHTAGKMEPIDPGQCLTSSQAKRMDKIALERLGLSGLVLMENAGIRSAKIISGRFAQARFVILCGTGNNGGDGLVIARQLAVCGRSVVVWLSGDTSKMSPECSANWDILNRLKLPLLQLNGPGQLPDVQAGTGMPTVIIDAMLGISARGEPREPIASAIRWANQQTAFRIAIDIPTGMDPDSGQTAVNSFQAQLTLTIERPKTFATNPVASENFGELVVVPLGIPPWIVEMAREISC